MRKRLVVICDGRVIDARNAERTSDLQCGITLRQLPEATEQALGLAAHEHELAIALDPERGSREHGKLAFLLACSDDRQLVLASGSLRLAVRGDRAEQAARRCRRAQRGPELHEALVQIAGRVIGGQRRHQLAGVRPQRLLPGRRFDVVLDRVEASEHTRDVAIDEWRALAKGDRCDRARGVRADARHRAQLARA